MEILNGLSRLLSPSFFGTIAGLSLAAAAMLFSAGKQSGKAANALKNVNKLSNLEPREYRGAGYLILAFGWSIFGLVFAFIFSALGDGVIRNVIISLSMLWLFFALCFFYAGAGEQVDRPAG